MEPTKSDFGRLRSASFSIAYKPNTRAGLPALGQSRAEFLPGVHCEARKSAQPYPR
jgi:hypothetical protein